MSNERTSPRVGAGRVFIGFVLVLATVQGAGAVHDASDLHSENMSLVATLDTGHGGDIAFWGDMAVLSRGSADGDPENDGFRLVDISDPTKPTEVGAFTCNGAGADVSVWRDVVFLSVNSFREKEPACDAGPGTPPSDVFLGLHMVSIQDSLNPRLIHSVDTCTDALDRERCGLSHTHTLVPDLGHRDPVTGKRDPRLIVYVNAGTQMVVEVPLRTPTEAQVIGSIAFAPPTQNPINGNSGGCHDVSVFLPRSLAVCAGGVSKQVQIWDITDPARPELMSVTENPIWEVAHGAGFSWDGDTLIVADESVANLLSDQCPGAGTAAPQSALWFYDISDPAVPVLRGFYQLDQPVTTGGCTAHQFNVVPLRSGRDVLVAGWGIGGTTVVDFTDPANSQQIAYYRARPEADPSESNHAESRSNSWSSYWYHGMVYTNNMFLAPPHGETATTERGFDVFTVDLPLLEDHIRVNRFNFGTQECLPRPHGEAHGNLSACTSPPM